MFVRNQFSDYLLVFGRLVPSRLGSVLGLKGQGAWGP